MKSINLVKSVGLENQGFSSLTKRLLLIAVFLASLAIISAAVFTVLLLGTKKELSDNQEKIISLKSSLSSLQNNQYYLLSIDDRVNKISNIMNSRIFNAQLFEDIRPLFVLGFDLLQISGSKARLMLSASCTDSNCLSELSKKLEEIKLNRSFSSVLLSSVGKTKQGNFLLTLEIGLKK